ncbi:MAG: Ig-like domain-containing protein, partial [Candidatus Aquicultorales bacterium]
GAWTVYSAPFVAPEGTHTLSVYSVDEAGNAEAPQSQTIKVDTANPTSSITAPANGATLSGASYSVTGTAADASSGIALVEISIDGGAWQAATGTTSWTYSWTLPSSGTYTIRSRSTDASGRVQATPDEVTVDVDNVSPVTTATTSPAVPDGSDGWFVTAPAVTLSSSEPGTTYYRWNGTGPWIAYAGPFSAPEGENTLNFYSADASGNTETPQSRTIKVDTADPSSTVADPAGGSTLTGSGYTVTGSASDASSGVSQVEISINGGAWTTATGNSSWSYSWTFPGDGTYTIRSRATDVSGRVETPGAGETVIVDNSAPVTTLTTSPAAPDGTNGFFITAPSVTLTADEPGTTYYQWDGTGGAWTTYSGSIAAPEGEHTLYYYSSDAYGNDESPKSQGIKVDTAAPSTTISTSPSSPDGSSGWFVTVPTVTLATEPGATTYYRFDSGAWATYAAPFVAPEGTHTLSVYSVDEAGNAETATNRTIKVDTTTPSSTIAAPTGDSTLTGASYAVTGTASDGTSGVIRVEVQINGGAWQTATGTTSWSYTWSLPSSGTYTIRSRAIDASGRIQAIPDEVTVDVDNMAPVTTLTTNPAAPDGSNGWFITAPTVALSASEPGATYYQWDGTGGSWSTYSTELTAPVGNHRLYFYSTDGLGNVETAKSQQIKVDLADPSSSIGAPAAGATLTGSSYTVTGNSSDSSSGVSRVEVSINGGAWQTATGTTSWSYSWTLPADGGYTIRSRATDASGRVETPGSGMTVQVDNSAPTSTLSTNPAAPAGENGWFITAPQVSISSNEPGATYYQWDGTGGEWETYAGAFPAIEGSHTLYFYSEDSHGNAETIQTRLIKVDTDAPSSTVNAPPDGARLNGASYLVTGTASDGSSGIAKVEISIDGGGWTPVTGTTSWNYSWTFPGDGTYTIRTRATDASGRVETPGAGTTVTVDTAAPSVTGTSPSGGAVDVDMMGNITATFSEDMQGSSLTASTFTLRDASNTPVAGAVSYNAGSRTVTFNPTSALQQTALYTATISTGAADLTGNNLAAPFVWSFTTGVPPLPITTLTTIVSDPDGNNDWFKTMPSVSLSFNSEGATYYQLNSTEGSWTIYSGAFAASEGEHIVYYYSVDNYGQIEQPVKSRALKVDVTSPVDPTPTSPSHTIDVASTDNTVDINLAGASDAVSGVDGYSIIWTDEPNTLPDTTKDREGDAASLTSHELSNGRWYFHLRTVDNAGNWTSTEHLGPFIINAPQSPVSSVPTASEWSLLAMGGIALLIFWRRLGAISQESQ